VTDVLVEQQGTFFKWILAIREPVDLSWHDQSIGMTVICKPSQIASAENIRLRRETYPIRRSGHASHLSAKTIKTMERHHDSLVDGIDVHIGGCDVGRGQLRQDVASHRLESTRRQPLFLDLLHGFPKGIRRPGEEKASRQVAGSKADASPTALLDHPHKPDVYSSLCGQRSRGSISRSERRPNRARRSEMDLKCSLRCLDGGRR